MFWGLKFSLNSNPSKLLLFPDCFFAIGDTLAQIPFSKPTIIFSLVTPIAWWFLVILFIIFIIFLVAFRIGWLRLGPFFFWGSRFSKSKFNLVMRKLLFISKEFFESFWNVIREFHRNLILEWFNGPGDKIRAMRNWKGILWLRRKQGIRGRK